MWKRSIFLSPLAGYSPFQGGRCLSCQFRNTTPAVLRSRSTLRYYARNSNNKKSNDNDANKSAPAPGNKVDFKQNTSPPETNKSEPDKPDKEDVTPRVLDRPIGSLIPPQEGQNSGVDERTLRERRDDFVSYDRHIARRKELYNFHRFHNF